MPTTATAPATPKVKHKRPAKSRSQRREADLRKYSENKDYKFLLRMGGAIGLLLLIALTFAIKGAMEQRSSSSQVAEMVR